MKGGEPPSWKEGKKEKKKKKKKKGLRLGFARGKKKGGEMLGGMEKGDVLRDLVGGHFFQGKERSRSLKKGGRRGTGLRRVLDRSSSEGKGGERLEIEGCAFRVEKEKDVSGGRGRG